VAPVVSAQAGIRFDTASAAAAADAVLRNPLRELPAISTNLLLKPRRMLLEVRATTGDLLRQRIL
jgi:hypothetical protein